MNKSSTNRHNIDNCSSCSILRDEIDVLENQLAEMQRRAHFDVLTKLPNRRFFLENLEHRILRCERYGDVTALLFLDVDNLKSINDKYGHSAGDEILRRFAQILSSNIRASDLMARIGGDEFAILLDNLDADQVELKINEFAARIDDDEIEIGGNRLKLGAAIGYCFVGPKDNVSGLMSKADAAMYKIKNRPQVQKS